MATKVKPCRIKATGTPQVGNVPVYVDEDTFQWGAGGGGGSGDVTGPNSSTDGDVVLFDGATGKVIKDSGVNLSSKLDASALSDTNYGGAWNGDTTHTATKNAIYTKLHTMDVEIGNKAADNTVVKLSGNQTIAGTKTFSTSPVVPSKTADATNDGTAIATEAQVYKKAEIAYATQAEYNALPSSKLTDDKHYFIYSTDGGGGWTPGVNTLLYYSFDNQNLNDGSVNGNNGTWYSTAGTYTTGISSYGVDVSNNSAITLPIKLPSGDMTFSICANVTTTSGVLQGFLGVDGWSSAGQIAFSINDTHGIDLLIHEGGSVTSLVTNTTPTTNTWFNAIFTRSGNVWTVYYNGTSVGTTTTSQSPSQSITYYISRNYNTTRYIRGVIDEVILENRAWTQQEITDYVTSLGIS